MSEVTMTFCVYCRKEQPIIAGKNGDRFVAMHAKNPKASRPEHCKGAGRKLPK